MTHDAVFASTGHLNEARKVADAIFTRATCSTRTTAARRRTGQVPVRRAHASRLRRHRPVGAAPSQTECLLECADGAQVLVTVRFLQVQHRSTWAAITAPARRARWHR